MISFGGNSAWKVQRVADLVRAYHWVDGEPAMVIFPARARLNAGAYVIKLSTAFQFDVQEKCAYRKENIKYMLNESAKAAKVMGMDNTSYVKSHICAAIQGGLDDLIKQPPEPQWVKDLDKGGVFAELEVKANGKTIIQRDVYEGDRGNVHG